MKERRFFSSPPAKELYSQPSNPGGWYVMPESRKCILEARRLRARAFRPPVPVSSRVNACLIAGVLVCMAVAVWVGTWDASGRAALFGGGAIILAVVLCLVYLAFNLFRRHD